MGRGSEVLPDPVQVSGWHLDRSSFELPAGAPVFVDSDSLEIETYLAGVDFHLLSRPRAHLTLGGFVAQSSFSDQLYLTALDRRLIRSFEDETSFGVKVGGAWEFVQTSSGGAWFAAVDGRYSPLTLEGDVQFAEGHELDLDPVILSAGIGYRF